MSTGRPVARSLRRWGASTLAALLSWGALPAVAQPLPVVATFSILGDWVKQVGGDRVAVDVLVPAGADSHVFQPTPAHARQLAQARVVFSNGLGFEGWVERLIRNAGFQGRHVVASTGIEPIRATGQHHHGHRHGHGHGHGHNHGHGHGHSHGEHDPHAWQSVPHAKVYVRNIADALCAADPAGCSDFRQRADAYRQQLQALDADIRALWAPIPQDQRRIIVSHDAFAYYGQAYGVTFFAARGVSSDSEPSARGIATLVRQIRDQQVRALFVENVTDPRLIERIGRETGLQVSGKLYSDSLTAPGGRADDFIAMMRYNTQAMTQAIRTP